MLTKNINFKNFIGKKNLKQTKYFKNFLKYNILLNKYPLLESLTKEYKYSYKKKKS